MRRNNINMGTMARRLAVCCLLLWSFAGQTMAQTDKPYVLKRQIGSTHHYLSHVNSGGTWVLQDATTFDPETCIWYSGPVFNVSGNHHNYYFYDEEADKYHFLSAPLAPNADLGYSADLPSTSQLKNPDEIYYFYDWDWDNYGGGVARGHDDNGSWKVHWVSYSSHSNKWLTSAHNYNIPDSSARFREVTVTEHDRSFNWTQNEIGNLSNFAMDYNSDPLQTEHPLSITIGDYSYTCTPSYTTYNFEGSDYNFHNNTFLGIGVTPTPSAPVSGSGSASSYEWKISGEGAAYLSFSSASGSNQTTSNIAAPNLYYTTENTQGRKTATLTLTMTFSSGETQATVVRTATVTVNTQCQNPQQAAAPVINHNDVTVTWYPTATKYKVEWKKASETSWNNSVEVGNVTSYTIIGLDEVEYDYRVIAYCGDAYLNPPTNPTGTFKPGAAPNLLIYGSVFGGGRAANVTQKTEVVIINCDSIGAVYGGNDIAGSAGGDDGSVITLGVNGTGTGATSAQIRIGSVYGGGNGYYAYGSTSFEPASPDLDTILPNKKVYALSPSGQWTDSVWTNTDTIGVPLPTIKKTAITVTNDYVKVDSVFGGAKNAFVTYDNVNGVNTTDTIKGGTIFAVFGGNNVGGTLAAAKQSVYVSNTTKDLTATHETIGHVEMATGTIGLGRTHGIGYLFGGGNLVKGSTTEITIAGGQLDTIFGGGNKATVDSAFLTVNCVGGNRITAAQFEDGHVTSAYGWDGNDIYNVHTLFGGNNRAHMNGVPYITLTSGGVGTAYGGGNAGDMLAEVQQNLDDTLVNISTHMKLNSDNMIVDNLYGGCQMSNVACCTWVEIMDGHVGTVYGGCNVSGDVGSTQLYPDSSAFIGPENNQKPNIEYQKVKGATYVKVSGGNVYRDVYAGSNGYYHCNDGVNYVAGMDYGDPDGSPEAYDPEGLYIGLPVPTHNATNVKVCGGRIRGNVYAGGNLACVGFTDYTVPAVHLDTVNGLFPKFVGLAFVEMSEGTVDGDVYGGGKMASVFGSNSVKVSGGHIGGALYGGNDRTGQVAQITNRVLPDSYSWASDGYTNLNQLNVKTYVRVTESANVNTVYGGGNGDYDYTSPNHIQFCGITPDEPIQSNTFVDIDIYGRDNIIQGAHKGHIGTVYGGGNGVTVINGITVLLNVNEPDYASNYDHVDTIFGGNNKGSLTLVPDIILLQGQVNTVYGGCNKGAMYGDYTFSTSTGVSSTGDSTYHHVGSLVRLRDVYKTYNNATDPNHTNPTSTTNPTARVSHAVYGGCRMNGVTNNSMVIVEGNSSDHVNAELFGGSDISGIVGGTSMVVVNGTDVTQVGNVYGGGNGHYDYVENKVYKAGMAHTEANLVATDTATVVAPYCAASRVDMLNGTCVTGHNIYAGGYAALSGATMMNIVGDTVYDRAFGGGNLAGTTTKSYTFANNTYSGDGSSTVNVTGGVVKGGVYGGNNLADTIVGAIQVNILGGKFGTSTSAPMTDGIFGGGYGNLTRTTGDVTVTVDKISGQVAPLIYGDVYGGSGYGDVNSPRANGADSDDITTVNIFDGTINGDIYGGGLGRNQIGDDPTTAYPAHVNGKAYVNVGTGGLNAQGCSGSISGNATINGSVYGCNNVNGTPLDSVFVNIYRTAHGADPEHNAYPLNPPTGFATWTLAALAYNDTAVPQAYAIKAVYGGGNKAAYLPPLANGQPRCATVHVWDCQQNTIEDVYGGGNAANVGDSTTGTGLPANTRVIIDGGRIHRMFGGGNGYSATHNHTNPSAPYYNPGANIFGTASSYVYAGLIDEVYGGANQWGSIDVINLNVLSTTCCTDAVYRKVFGCANEAPINHDIVTTVGCGVGVIGELYGGSNLASIGVDDPSHRKANVTLNLYGGNYHQVFGGSKGSLETPVVAADIFGDVTLNLYGGTVIDAFGGSDQNGDIKGIITVNVLDYEDCPLDLTNVYGGSNKANYDPWLVDEEKVTSPIVNVMHIHNVDNVGGQQVMRGIRGNVYGGGYQATINANPVVNIGLDSTVVVYGTTTMADLIPDNYPSPNQLNQLHNFPHAFISGKAFGGGDLANVTGHTTVNMRESQSQVDTIFGGGNQASVSSAEVNVYDGKVVNGVYGGCNIEGTVSGDIVVNMLGGTLGTETDDIVVFGGGLGQPTATNDNVTVNIGGTGYAPVIYGTVYGGSALGSVNASTNDTVGVHLISGTVNGDVFGGGLGVADDPATTNVNEGVMAHVNGNIHVVGDGGNVNGWVFGANDQNGDPAGTVVVTINDGSIGNVVGGGNVAEYTAPSNQLDYPFVTINGGTVTNKVVGGGNNADITGNPHVLVTGGTVGTDSDATTGIGKGIYGGCNSTGIVTGSTYVTLTGGTVGVSGTNTANIHGGGYGKDTEVHGDVLVIYGNDNNVHSIYPLLYGELYGGSALGTVNINGGSNTTTVNLVNGTIHGEAYGGGLGQQPVTGETPVPGIAAMVYGDVQVNVGNAGNVNYEDTYTGQANLADCDVYGCNNLYGTPKKLVFVDVYQTYHIEQDSANYLNPDASFAIDQVFGGGNMADYMSDLSGAKVDVYVHLCKNTVRRVFGGGNAAYVPGVELTIDGGRFDQVYGGGNGELGAAYAANVGTGGIHILLGGGRIRLLVNGSNDFGLVEGTIVSETAQPPVCSESVVEDYFLGNNHTDLYEDIEATIYCGEGNGILMKFVNLYCGSNQAKQYGNINVTIEGGVFENVYGGSKGALDDPTTPDVDESFEADICIIDQSIIGDHPGLADRVGDGGNITLTIKGGTIGDLYGGCNVNGNVEGKISLTIHEDELQCPLFIGNIYGASNQTNYAPVLGDIVSGVVSSPEVKIAKGTIGGLTSILPIGNPHDTIYPGNVYGGGKVGHVTSNPKVIVGNGTNNSPVTIEGNVFGGGHRGNVDGNPVVLVVPDRHKLYFDQPNNSEHGVIKVITMISDTVETGYEIGEGHDVRLEAYPSVYGYKLQGWSVTTGNGHIANTALISTLFTMGTEDTRIAATFTTATTHPFTYTQPQSGGTIQVTDRLDQTVPSGSNISEGAVLKIKATPATGYVFEGWTVTSGNGVIKNVNKAETTFIMGTTNNVTHTITATFRANRSISSIR